jgi:predicted RNA-binding protein YlxR (DUF448 family)
VKDRKDLIKITADYKDGNVIVNPSSLTFGRSVYLCYNKNCIDMAFKKNKLNKMLKTGANINKENLLDLINTEDK